MQTRDEILAKKRERNRIRRADPELRRQQYDRRNAHRKGNPQAAERHRTKRTYLAGPDREKIAQLAQEHTVCMICEEECWRALAIDHCHKKNIVRGFLCSACNSGLGYFRDNPKLLKKAAEYVRGTDIMEMGLKYERYNGYRGRKRAGKKALQHDGVETE